MIPGGFQPGGIPDLTLPLARRRHDRLDHAGKAGVLRPRAHFLQRFGIAIARSRQAQFPGGEIANAVAVHRQLGRAGGRDDGEALPLQLDQHLGADGLDLGHDEIGAVLLHRGAQGRAVEHREHLPPVGHLHRGGIVIGIAGHDPRAEPLGRDDEFAPQFAGAEEEDGRSESHGRRPSAKGAPGPWRFRGPTCPARWPRPRAGARSARPGRP